jgi:hypothetical protein
LKLLDVGLLYAVVGVACGLAILTRAVPRD